MAYYLNTAYELLHQGQFQFPVGEQEKFFGALEQTALTYGTRKFSALDGLRVDPVALPKRPRAQFKTKKLGDFVSAHLCLLVSERAKDFLEDMDPGAHQYALAELEQENGSPWPELYWVFNIGTRIDTAVDENRSDVIRSYPDSSMWHFALKPEVHEPKIYLRNEIIGAHNFWFDARLWSNAVMSDRFWQLSQKAGFKEISCGDFNRHLIEI